MPSSAPWSSGHGDSSSTSVPSASNSTASYRPPGRGAAPVGPTWLRRRRGPARPRRCSALQARRRRRPAPGSRSGAPSRRAARGRSGSEGASWFTFAPPASLASFQPPRWPQPCGSATVPARHLVRDHRPAPRTAPDSDVMRAMSAVVERRRRAASSGWMRSACVAAAAHQQRRVVHPGVVRAQLAQADQAQREVAARRRSRTPAARPRASATASSDVHTPVAVAHAIAEHAGRDLVAEHDRRAAARPSFLSDRPERRRPNQSPAGPDAQQQRRSALAA